MLKKALTCVTTGVVALGGLVVFGAGPAGAGKPVLNGTLTCKVSSTISISPPLLATVVGKDKKAKLNSTGALSNCTGNEPTSGLPIPTGGTTTTKSKAAGHSCSGALGGNGGPPTITKGKLTFTTLPKAAKAKANSTTANGAAFDPGTQVKTPFPMNATATQITNFVLAHLTDRLYFELTGVSGGKAYAGKTFQTKVVTLENFTTLFVAGCSGAGLSTIHVDPVFSTFNVL